MEEESELEREQRLMSQTSREFQSLVKSPGWVKLVEILKQRQVQHMARMVMPAEGVDGLVAKEHWAGRYAEVIDIEALPHDFIRAHNEDMSDG